MKIIKAIKVSLSIGMAGMGFFMSTVHATTDVDGAGNAVAEDLHARYNYAAEGCGVGATAPAFECSGIIARTTSPDSNYAWDSDSASGGVSFSFLRTDIPVELQKAWDGISLHGFIFDAPEHIRRHDDGREKLLPTMLCYFPSNGLTLFRTGDGGCGVLFTEDNIRLDGTHINTYIDATGPCHMVGVYTAEDWMGRYGATPRSSARGCGFNVRVGSGGEVNGKGSAKSNFNQGILVAQQLLRRRQAFGKNELVIRAWGQQQNDPTIGGKLPIQAFFYANEEGKGEAQREQADYYNITGIFVPLIKVVVSEVFVDNQKPLAIKYEFVYKRIDQSVGR